MLQMFSNLTSYVACKNHAAIRFTQKQRYPAPSFRHDPLVSVLIVTHNSQEYLSALARALEQQSYHSFELIIVDNASTDNSIEESQRLFQNSSFAVTITKCPANSGFAGGCNLALHESQGELIALLNTDAIPEKDWLLELVHALRLNPWAAVASPKILFNGYFQRINLFFPSPVIIALKPIVQSLTYPKIFLRTGTQEGVDSIRSNPHGCISFDLPSETKFIPLLITPVDEPEFIHTNTPSSAESSSPQLRVESEANMTYVSIPWGSWTGNDPLTISIPKGAPQFRIVNNAGSTSGRILDHPKDRGFGNIDCSYYDHPIRTSRFCGCAPLIRRSAVIDRQLFSKEFFAYYEDSDLGRWLIQNKRGESIYWPRAVVSHYHSSTIGEKSPAWTYLTQRSWILYQQLGLPAHQPSKSRLSYLNRILNDLASQARQDLVNSNLLEIIRQQDISFLAGIQAGNNQLKSTRRKAIGVYNLYWNTRGGGESHALAVAAALHKQYPDSDIYLISETDFDLDELGKYFSIDISGLRKLTTCKVTSNLTERFWLFINSTSHSPLLSRALNSWYIVSFPHRTLFGHWLNGYKLLCNSQYTRYHCRLRWGAQDAHILYPVLQFDPKDMIAIDEIQIHKQPYAIAVGRFTRRGHAKNQHHIISAFNQACKRKQSSSTYWRLQLIGSLETSNYEDCCYFKDLESQIQNSHFKDRIQLITNAARHELERSLNQALIYVHATGLDAPKSKPEMQEHFGIAPVEAALRGCIPLVYDQAGPAEVTRQTGCGHQFCDKDDLTKKFELLMNQPLEILRKESEKTALSSQRWVLQNQKIPFDQLLVSD